MEKSNFTADQERALGEISQEVYFDHLQNSFADTLGAEGIVTQAVVIAARQRQQEGHPQPLPSYTPTVRIFRLPDDMLEIGGIQLSWPGDSNETSSRIVAYTWHAEDDRIHPASWLGHPEAQMIADFVTELEAQQARGTISPSADLSEHQPTQA